MDRFTRRLNHKSKIHCTVEALETRRLMVTVSGTVASIVDASHAVPLAGALVILQGTNFFGVEAEGEARTDAAGDFTVGGTFNSAYPITLTEYAPSGYEISALFQEPYVSIRSATTASVNITGDASGVVFYDDKGPATPAAPPDLTIKAAQATVSQPAVAGYSTGTVSGTIANQGSASAIGHTDITLYASAPGRTTPLSGDPVVAVVSGNTDIRGGQSKTFGFKFTLPKTLTAGSYTLVVGVNTHNEIAESNTANNFAAASGTINVAVPTIDMGILFGAAIPANIPPVKGESVSAVITNTGNIPVTGPVTLSLYASADGKLDSSAVLLKSLKANVRLKTGGQKTARLSFAGRGPHDALAAGNYYLIATLQSPLDTNTSNNEAISTAATTFT